MESADAQRICYYVFERGSTWLVEFDHQYAVTQFPDRTAALRAARDAAEARWLMTGNASCVRLGEPDSNETEMAASYG